MNRNRTVYLSGFTCCLLILMMSTTVAVAQLQRLTSLEKSSAPKQAVAVESQPEALTSLDADVKPAGCCDAGGDAGCGRGQGCCGSSQCCKAVCCPKKVTNEVKKHYWLVKPEMVCIPGFRFECNWGKRRGSQKGGCCKDTCCESDTCCSGDKCCANDPGKPTCGRVRCINVLEKHEYKCDECGYQWEVKCVRKGGRGSCCGKGDCCCPSCGCAAANGEVNREADVQLTSAAEPVSAETKQEKRSLSGKLMNWLR